MKINSSMRKSLSTLFFILFLFCNVFGQKNFLPGYVLNKDKDTIKGFVDYRNWDKNPYKIIFKEASSGPEKSYGVNDIEGFEVYGSDIYKRAVVLLDMSAVDMDRVYQRAEIEDKTDTIFLRFLTQGRNLRVYEFVDHKYHFFMQKEDGPIEELIYKLRIDEQSGNLRTIRGYVQQIKMALVETGITSEQSRAVDRMKYNASDFRKFFSGLDGSLSSADTTKSKKGKKSSQFFAGAGITQQQLGFSAENPALNSLKFDHSVSYIIAAGVDFFSGRNFRNLVLRGELSLNEVQAKGSGKSKTGSTGTGQHNEYLFKQINITPTISFLYKFLGNTKARPYLGIGIGYNISTYPKHTLTYTNELTGSVRKDDNFPELEKQWMGIYARTGVILHEKFELGLTAQVSGSFINYSGIGEKSRPVSLRLSYRL